MTDANGCALLGQLLLHEGAITQEQLEEALRLQTTSTERIGEILLRMGAIAEEQLARALRAQIRLRGRSESDKPYILVVDDDPEVGAVVADILDGAGYRVGVAQSGREAMSAILAPDLPAPCAIVLDLGLPEQDGVQVLAALRRIDGTETLPVVVLTGRPDLGSRIAEQGLAVSALLAKPIAARQLLSVVEAAVRGEAPAPIGGAR